VNAALLAEIRARPEDDAPRLVYADWLTEQGDPYGEFIRLQCARARGDDAGELRERELWAQHGASWCQTLGVEREHVEFRRGFVEKVLKLESPSERLLEHPVQALHIEPPFDRGLTPAQAHTQISWAVALRPRELNVSVWQRTNQADLHDLLVRPLLLSEAVARVRRLKLSTYMFELGLADQLFTDLSRHPSLGELHAFEFYGSSLSEQALSHFLGGQACQKLQKLVLLSGPIDGTLRALPLTSLKVGIHLERRLLGWPQLGELEELGLIQDGAGPQNLPALLSACSQLTELELTGFGRMNQDLPSLQAFTRLRRLRLQNNRLSADDVLALFDGPWVGSLELLALPGSYLRGGRAFAHLGQRLGPVKILDVSHTGLDDAGLHDLAEHGALQHVRELQLPRVSPQGLQLLADAAPALRVLRLRSLELPALRVLTGSLAERLRDLSVTMDLDEPLLTELADAPFLRLRRLVISGIAGGFERMRRAAWFTGLERASLREVLPAQMRSR
jgi:uncharacterized protein (TIGR02996 family)